MSQKTPEWWAEYKCPKCGYKTIVTDVCRRCQRTMFATGFEEKSEVKEDKLKIHRRKMTQKSDCYNHAVLMSGFAKNQCEEIGAEIPIWAWFGERGK